MTSPRLRGLPMSDSGLGRRFSDPQVLCSLPLISLLLTRKIYKDTVHCEIKALHIAIVKGRCDLTEET